MNYLIISKHSERREEMKSILRQLDRRAHMQDAHDWRQAESALARESRDLVFADLTCLSDHRAAETTVLRHPGVALAAIADELDAHTTVELLRSGLRAVIPRDMDWRSMIRALELVLLGGHYVPPHALHLSAIKLPPPPASALEAAERILPYRRRLIDATSLSPRQQQIMRLVHMGSTNKSIARALGISEGTVKIHLATVFKMLGASNRAAAVAIYNGWLFDQVQGLRERQQAALAAAAPTVMTSATSLASLSGPIMTPANVGHAMNPWPAAERRCAEPGAPWPAAATPAPAPAPLPDDTER
jgi:DNA-binding NarL/FixJ family response regulator